MTIVRIKNLIWFAPNIGVLVGRDALQENPHQLHQLIELAWQHMDNPYLENACHGGEGPLAQYNELDFEDFLRICEEARIAEATKHAKHEFTLIRRADYSARRAQLALAMIESGILYVCSKPNCGETQNLTIDHIIPLSRGGTDELKNLRFLCRPHNSKKGDKLAES
jgi:HNH endonuclease